MSYANPKYEILTIEADPEGGFWIWANGERGPMSALPGAYARKIFWTPDWDIAETEVSQMIQADPKYFRRGKDRDPEWDRERCMQDQMLGGRQ